MSELITLQIGQCGNQLGARYWQLALAEYGPRGVLYDQPLSTLFHNVDDRQEIGSQMLACGTPIASLRARAVLVDMECGVLNQIARSNIGELFDPEVQFVSDVSGSGNNWAVGYYQYGGLHGLAVEEAVRRQLETADRPQGLLFAHSAGGGTGSGLGTYILEMLADSDPKLPRISTVVFPSIPDDVITSPYNALLATAKLIQHASCVLPVCNEALAKFSKDLTTPVARLWLDVTAGTRFGEARRVGDTVASLTEVRRTFLIPSLSPAGVVTKDLKLQARSFDALFSETNSFLKIAKLKPQFAPKPRLGLFVRCKYSVSDVQRSAARLAPSVLSVCPELPSWAPFSVASLRNSAQVAPLFADLLNAFDKLFARRAHLHHYAIERDEMLGARDRVLAQFREY